MGCGQHKPRSGPAWCHAGAPQIGSQALEQSRGPGSPKGQLVAGVPAGARLWGPGACGESWRAWGGQPPASTLLQTTGDVSSLLPLQLDLATGLGQGGGWQGNSDRPGRSRGHSSGWRLSPREQKAASRHRPQPAQHLPPPPPRLCQNGLGPQTALQPARLTWPLGACTSLLQPHFQAGAPAAGRTTPPLRESARRSAGRGFTIPSPD